MTWFRTFLFVVVPVVFAGCGDAGDPKAGRWVWLIHCSDCHGEKGVPMVPAAPDFSRCEGMEQFDFQLAKTIRDGTETMPAAGELIDEDDINNVVAYIRTLYK